jgi:hypothetical protein
MSTVRVDKITKCECGHEAGHHRNELPKPCRLCDCEAFISPRQRAKVLAEDEEGSAWAPRP